MHELCCFGTDTKYYEYMDMANLENPKYRITYKIYM